ncbi:MAG: flagellar hook protein FlgE [Steroidobacterales bacterium]
MSSFSIALSGLTAASSDLDVTANNIANADTVGFKSSRVEFADVYASGGATVSSTAIGEGVRVASTSQQFTQGNVTTTGGNLDLAISGNGFFTLKNPSGYAYTRNGAFTEDNQGNVVTATGQFLQVYPPLATGGFNTGALSNLNLQTSDSAPQATTSGTAILNLPANATPPTVAPFNAANSQTYNQSTATTVYDSLGNGYPATMFFANTGVNAWNVYMTVGGQTLGPQALTFNTAGAVATPVGGALAFTPFNPPSGATQGGTLTFNFGQSTQYGNQFGVASITQNGYATGQLSTVSIDPTGVVSAVYTNGRSTQLGQIAMANFPNPQGLSELGNTNWSSTFQSGVAVQGTAGSAGFGNIQSGALESSNVDLTTQLVNMITAQRAFDSNAQVITVSNQLSQTVINATH